MLQEPERTLPCILLHNSAISPRDSTLLSLTNRVRFSTNRAKAKAMRHRDDLGPLAPRAVSGQVACTDGWVEQTLEFDAPRVAVAALLAMAPQV